MKLTEALAIGWRIAENDYLLTRDGSSKEFMFAFQKELNLTEKQVAEVEEIANSYGV